MFDEMEVDYTANDGIEVLGAKVVGAWRTNLEGPLTTPDLELAAALEKPALSDKDSNVPRKPNLRRTVEEPGALKPKERPEAARPGAEALRAQSRREGTVHHTPCGNTQHLQAMHLMRPSIL